MPSYDYKCTKCEHIDVVVHKMSETPDVKCTQCGALMEKQISVSSGIIFKGSWFKTEGKY